jgi:hypothetical protein
MAVQEPVGTSLWRAVKPMVAWPQADEDTVGLLAEDWAAAGKRFEDAGRYRVDTAGWTDEAGGAFHGRSRATLDTALLSAQGMHRLSGRAAAYAEEVAGVKRGINEIVALNEVTYGSLLTLPDGVAQRAQESFLALVAADMNKLVTDAAGRVGATGGPPPAIPPPPPAGASPQEWSRYWGSLTEDQRVRLATEQPDLVGNQDGVYAAHRDLANRSILGREIAEAQREVDDLTARGASAEEIAAEQKQLDGLNHLAGLPGPAQGGDYYLLKVEGSGDGLAVVASGNPDTAANVATWVPGVMTDIGSAQQLVTDANGIRNSAGPGNTAVIGWLGYDTPNSLWSPPLLPAPNDAAADLNRFQEGLRSTHDGAPSHNSIVGHSYGGYTSGLAARNHPDMPIDELVYVSAPGAGAGHAGQLNLPEGAVWATEADGDIIADVGITGEFGADPTGPFFGAQTVNSTPGTPVPHEAYRAEGPGLWNVGDIVADRPPDDQKG